MEILLVDDDLEALTGLARGLRAAGHTVTAERDGVAALEAARARPPQVVLADVMMPGLNGYQLCRRLRQLPETAAIPVLLMSPKVDPADHFWAGEVGARALLMKPLELADALTQLAAAVRAARPADRPGDVA